MLVERSIILERTHGCNTAIEPREGGHLRVTTHFGDEPLGATMGPNTERPSVELFVSENDLVQVHDTASESVDTLVDLAVCFPSVSSIGLSDSVERAVSQEVIVAVLGDSCGGRFMPWNW